jgi:hypothetical protein
MITIDDYRRLACVTSAATQPDEIFAAVAAIVRERIGFGLLTMLLLTPDGDEVQRLYTTDPVNYPVSGRERLGTTAWGQHVLVDGKPYLGADRAAVAWAFPGDFDLIAGLGLGATMNLPIVALRKTMGSMNILDTEGRYGEPHLDAAATLAPYLAVPFLKRANALR